MSQGRITYPWLGCRVAIQCFHSTLRPSQTIQNKCSSHPLRSCTVAALLLLPNVSPRLCIKPTQLGRMDQHIASLLLATLSSDAATRSQAEAGLNDAQNHGGSWKLFTRISTRPRNAEIYLAVQKLDSALRGSVWLHKMQISL